MGRVALITGANRGLGRALAERLARQQVLVVIGARALADAEKTAKEIAMTGGQATAMQLDVTDESSVESAAESIRALHGRLDVLINNAGILVFDELGVVRTKTIEEIYAVNVFGAVRVIEHMLPLLRHSEDARIINVSSETGSFASMTDPDNPYYGQLMIGYTTSKAALNAITVQTAKILAPDAISVYAVNPGYLDTDMSNHTGPRSPYEAAEHIVWLALHEPKMTSGTFYSDREVIAW